MASTDSPVLLIADCPGIDFLNSVASPNGHVIDTIDDGAGLVHWLEQAAMLNPHARQMIVAGAAQRELDAIAARARALREWFRQFVVRYRGAPLPGSALQELAPLNALLGDDATFSVIVTREGPLPDREHMESGAGLFERRSQRHWREPAALLLPIANVLADVICSVDFTHLKACEGHGCSLQYLDRTKGHKRRWCSMAVCGNRAKQAAHREKTKRGPQN